MDEQRTRQIISEEIGKFLKNDKAISDRLLVFGDGRNVQTGRTNGTRFGTASDQKISFFGATPVSQRAISSDLIDSLQALGLLASGAGNTPLDLGAGAVSLGALTMADGSDMTFGTSTGTKFGGNYLQKIAFYGATPIIKPSSTGQLGGATTGTSDYVRFDSSFSGGTGSTEYTIGDIVKHLKTLGLLTS